MCVFQELTSVVVGAPAALNTEKDTPCLPDMYDRGMPSYTLAFSSRRKLAACMCRYSPHRGQATTQGLVRIDSTMGGALALHDGGIHEALHTCLITRRALFLPSWSVFTLTCAHTDTRRATHIQHHARSGACLQLTRDRTSGQRQSHVCVCVSVP